MRYFLTDFVRLGVVFMPTGILSASPKKLEMLGDLVYSDRKIHVKVRVSKRGVSRVVSVLDNEKEVAIENFKWLHDFRKSALQNNTNGIRDIARNRFVSFCCWYLCFVFHLLTILCIINSFTCIENYFFLFLFFCVVVFSLYKLCRNKWKLIPHASNHYGESYGC